MGTETTAAQSRPRWFASEYLAAEPEGEVNYDEGVIRGLSVVTAGVVGGHGVAIEEEFVDETIKQGNQKNSGAKCRFGHPNMCSTALGTFLGRQKNFRRETIERDDGQKVAAAKADLFLSNEAKETPNGNLYDYVMGLAKNEPDMFGTSIVFTPGAVYFRTKAGKKVYRHERGYIDSSGNVHDEEKDPVIDYPYVEMEKLHDVDCVDDPAANDGLFSRFSQETIAGQVT